MIKKKLVLKKQIVASLSDLEKKKVLGGFALGTGDSLKYSICEKCTTMDLPCQETADLPCPSQLC